MNEKVKPSDIMIENDIGSWNLLHHGGIAGSYMGLFKFRCFLTPLQIVEADKDFRDLLGPNAAFAASNAENVAYALAQLRQRIVSAPPFWTEGAGRYGGGGIKDHDILDLVLEAAVTAEIKFRADLTKRHEEAIDRIKALMEKRKKDEVVNEEFEDAKKE
jgi:hypothetical protein